MHFDTWAKHSPGNSKKYAASLSVLVKELKKRFQGCKNKHHQFFSLDLTPFSVDVNT